jgi:hypothetical protein
MNPKDPMDARRSHNQATEESKAIQIAFVDRDPLDLMQFF